MLTLQHPSGRRHRSSAALLKSCARHVAAGGDRAATVAAMIRAREPSGARWTEEDARLLLDYRQ